jgi:membrane protease YdiL (CAAX protease family)
MPGICEELLLRGGVLAGLLQRVPVWAAILIAALLFALLHASPARFAPQLVLGVGLGFLSWRSGSVWAAVPAHAMHNALVLLLALGLHLQGQIIAMGLLVTLALPGAWLAWRWTRRA